MKYIIYTAAIVLGLFLRTIICAYEGWQYSINGVDILMAAAMFCMVYSLHGLIRPSRNAKQKRNERRCNYVQQNSHYGTHNKRPGA